MAVVLVRARSLCSPKSGAAQDKIHAGACGRSCGRGRGRSLGHSLGRGHSRSLGRCRGRGRSRDSRRRRNRSRRRTRRRSHNRRRSHRRSRNRNLTPAFFAPCLLPTQLRTEQNNRSVLLSCSVQSSQGANEPKKTNDRTNPCRRGPFRRGRCFCSPSR